MGVFIADATSPGTIDAITDLLNRGGVLALLVAMIVFILLGEQREWIYFRPYVRLLRERLTERDTRLEAQDKRIAALEQELADSRADLRAVIGTAEKAVVVRRRSGGPP